MPRFESQFSPPHPVDEYTEDSFQKMAVLFTDIVETTKYFKVHGDVAGRKMLQSHEDLVSASIVEHSGVVIKTIGDSILAYFLDPKEAVRSAVAIQQKFRLYNEKRDPDDQINIRVGIHFGEGIVEKEDIFGSVVNLASKIVGLAGGSQIYLSQSVFDLVKDLPSLYFELADLSDKKRSLKKAVKGLALYEVKWDEAIECDPTTRIILYMKPLWNLSGHDFARIWDVLLEKKDSIYGGKILKESILPDKSIVLVGEEASLSIFVAAEVLKFLRESFGSDNGHVYLPLRIIIDSGFYLRADRLMMEGLEVNWNEIDPGEIYISPSAYMSIKVKRPFPIDPSFDKGITQAFYKLILEGQPKKEELGETLRFLFNRAFVEGSHKPCYYCGSGRHLSQDCPSKRSEDIGHFLKELGYLSERKIKDLFYLYLSGLGEDRKPMMEEGINPGVSDLSIHEGFYELKSIFQIRFLRVLWDSLEDNWDKIKIRINGGQHKGGLVWLAQDCIRVSNLKQAEALLNTSIEKDPEDYKAYCSMGFLNIERNAFSQAKVYFNKALDCAETKPKRIFVLFLLFRIYYLEGNFLYAEQKIEEIIKLHPQCPEAIYQNIVSKFHKGLGAEAVTELMRFIQSNPEYYINILIDPELVPFDKIIQPELTKLFALAKKKAQEVVSMAEEEFERFKRLAGEEDKDMEGVTSLYAKIKELSNSDSYLGYLGISRYANMIISMCRGIITEWEKKISKDLYELTDRYGKEITFANNFPYKDLVKNLNVDFKVVQDRIDSVKGMVESGSPGAFKKSFSSMDELYVDIDKVYSKIKSIKRIACLRFYLSKFFIKSLIIQAIIFFVGLICFPIINYYLGFIHQELICSSQELWLYQKGFLIIGGIIGLCMAFLMIIKKPFPE